MGERQPAAPSALSPDGLGPTSEDWEPRFRRTERLLWAIRVAGLLLVAATLGLVLLGDRLLSPDGAKALEVAAILVSAASAILIAAYTRRRHVEVERAYSAHLETLSRRLRELAYRDSLTGLHNHRYLREQLAHEVERAHRYGHRLSVLMLDVDHFKQVNDTYGHMMGDTLLVYVAKLIVAKIRSSDIAARYGGDEFAVILPEADQEKAAAVGEKLGSSVSASRHWQAALLSNVGVGICCGVASFPDDGRTADDLLACADRRLYRAKRRRPPIPQAEDPSPEESSEVMSTSAPSS